MFYIENNQDIVSAEGSRLQCKLSSKSGFTLVEVVFAMMLMVLGLGSAALTINMAMKTSKATENKMEALHVARDRIERVTALGFTDPAIGAGTYSFTNGTVSGTYTVADEPPGPNPSFKNIGVQVPWFNTVTDTQSVVEVGTTMASAVP